MKTLEQDLNNIKTILTNCNEMLFRRNVKQRFNYNSKLPKHLQKDFRDIYFLTMIEFF
jgi:hypothetical protein